MRHGSSSDRKLQTTFTTRGSHRFLGDRVEIRVGSSWRYGSPPPFCSLALRLILQVTTGLRKSGAGEARRDIVRVRACGRTGLRERGRRTTALRDAGHTVCLRGVVEEGLQTRCGQRERARRWLRRLRQGSCSRSPPLAMRWHRRESLCRPRAARGASLRWCGQRDEVHALPAHAWAFAPMRRSPPTPSRGATSWRCGS